jgi:hypothetical protein
MKARRIRSFASFFSLGVAVAVACGAPNDGHVNIVDEESGGSGGSRSAGASAGSNGKSGGSGLGGDGFAGEGSIPVSPDPPVVVSVTPSGDDLAEPTGVIEIEFSEGLDPDTVTLDNIKLLDGEVAVPGTLDYSGVTVTFTPDERLDLLGTYTVKVTTDITDAQGTAMEDPYETTVRVRDGVWSEELVVENEDGNLLSSLTSPVIDARGNALVVWSQGKSSAPNVHSVWGRFFHPGEGWSDSFEIDETDSDCTGVSVAMNANGDAVVAWQQYENSEPQVMARRYVDGKWDTAERLDVVPVPPSNGYDVTTAMSPTGEAHVFWIFNDGMYVNLHGSHAAGDEPWSKLEPIAARYQLSRPAVAFDPSGNGFVFFVARTSQSGGETYLYGFRYIRSKKEWDYYNDPIANSHEALLDDISAVANDKGGAHVLFVRRNAGMSTTYDVAEAHFTKAEGFSSATAIDNLDTMPASVPFLATNGRARIAAWSQYASSTENAYSALSDGDGYLTQELRSDGDYSVEYGDVVAGLDRRGNGLILFAQVAPGNDYKDVRILFARLAGGEWSEAVKINQEVAQYQDARVAVAANGVAVAAWSVGVRQTATSLRVAAFE